MSLGLVLDLPGAAVKLYQVIRQDRELQNWLRLIFSTCYSGFLGLLGAWGTALISKSSPWISFGYGLLGCTVSVMTVLLNSPQARSLILSIPQDVVKQYQAPPADQAQTVIIGPDAPKK